LVAATNGVGYLIMQAGGYLNVGLAFSGIIVIALLGLALDCWLRGLARWSIRARAGDAWGRLPEMS